MRSSLSRAAIGASAACLTLSAVPALAIDYELQLTATVHSSCTLAGSSISGARALPIPVTNGVISTTPFSVEIPISCNAPASLVVESIRGGLRGPTTTHQTLSNRIDYIANVDAPFYMPITLDTTNAQGRVTSTDYVPAHAPNGIINVTITPQATPLPLQFGDYADEFRLTFTPAQ